MAELRFIVAAGRLSECPGACNVTADCPGCISHPQDAARVKDTRGNIVTAARCAPVRLRRTRELGGGAFLRGACLVEFLLRDPIGPVRDFRPLHSIAFRGLRDRQRIARRVECAAGAIDRCGGRHRQVRRAPSTGAAASPRSRMGACAPALHGRHSKSINEVVGACGAAERAMPFCTESPGFISLVEIAVCRERIKKVRYWERRTIAVLSRLGKGCEGCGTMRRLFTKGVCPWCQWCEICAGCVRSPHRLRGVAQKLLL